VFAFIQPCKGQSGKGFLPHTPDDASRETRPVKTLGLPAGRTLGAADGKALGKDAPAASATVASKEDSSDATNSSGALEIASTGSDPARSHPIGADSTNRPPNAIALPAHVMKAKTRTQRLYTYPCPPSAYTRRPLP
jgi:hypothetical protein